MQVEISEFGVGYLPVEQVAACGWRRAHQAVSMVNNRENFRRCRFPHFSCAADIVGFLKADVEGLESLSQAAQQICKDIG